MSTTTTNITNNLPTIAAQSFIAALNISVWEGRRKDKGIEEEVAASKGARSRRAASVYKALFVDCPALESIKALRGEARAYLNKHTKPWDDNGRRILPTGLYYSEVQAGMAQYAQRFDTLVGILVANWNNEISKQAFERGAMFDRNEYPDVSDVREKFAFSFDVEPMPMAGDFRVDVGNEALAELQRRYEAKITERVNAAMADTWQRVRDQVEWVRERMAAVLEHEEGTDEDGKKKRRPKLYESMLDTGVELCGLLRDLNITGDSRLEEVRCDLERALTRVDIDSLKESKEMQSSLKSAMDAIVDKFDF